MNKYNFESYNNQSKEAPIIILHGWGGSIKSLHHLSKNLSQELNHPIYSLELPGFGKTDMYKDVMNISDYGKYIKDFIKSLKLKSVILIGHSFGGKTSIYLTIEKELSIKKLVLINSSGLKPNNSFKKSISKFATKVTPKKLKKNKLIKNTVYKYILRERDYLNAGKLKVSLSTVVEEHFDDNISKINIPTLIVWGENDNYVPVWMGEKLEKNIKNSKLVIVPNATHGLPLKQPKLVAEIVGKWITDLENINL